MAIEFPQYLTGVSSDYTRAAAKDDLYGQLGLLVTPDTGGCKGRSKIDYLPHITDYHNWAADNGCFSRGGAFNEQEFIDMLTRAYETIPDAHDSCLFAVAPDVFDPKAKRGDPIATIERSLPVLPKIRDVGAPAALVFQDGLETMPERIPWDDFDVAFIGGGDEFKLGYPHHYAAARAPVYDRERADTIRWAELMWACHEHGKEIHLARVNSHIRLCVAIGIGAQSVDGTFIAFGGEKNLNRIRDWYTKLWAPWKELKATFQWFLRDENSTWSDLPVGHFFNKEPQ